MDKTKPSESYCLPGAVVKENGVGVKQGVTLITASKVKQPCIQHTCNYYSVWSIGKTNLRR